VELKRKSLISKEFLIRESATLWLYLYNTETKHYLNFRGMLFLKLRVSKTTSESIKRLEMSGDKSIIVWQARVGNNHNSIRTKHGETDAFITVLLGFHSTKPPLSWSVKAFLEKTHTSTEANVAAAN
jgi:hypothetical protein